MALRASDPASEEMPATQRNLLSASLILLTVAGLYALTEYVEQHASTCRERRPGGFNYILCYQFDFFPGIRAMAVEDFLFATRVALGPVGVFLAALLFYPQVPRIVATLGRRWRTAYMPVALAAAGIGLGTFIFCFGNRQFGAFDFSILLEHGWRLVQGQIPYRDFVCTLPPGFFLGIKWAFLTFGVRWNAVLWSTGLFAATTFLWIYALLRAILEKPLAAFLTALSVQAAANLVLCFWWYNNVTNITVTVFFLSCLLFLMKPNVRWTQISYTTSLALLGLMKPNLAGLTGITCVLVLFACMARRVRLLLLTMGAVAANLLFLTANHVSVPELLASYGELARGRSGALLIGLTTMPPAQQIHAAFFLVFLLLPFWIWPARLRTAIRERNWAWIGYCLLLLAAPAISIMGMVTNGEFKDVEWPILICGGVILLYGSLKSANDPPLALTRPWTARVYVCALFALMASDIYMGMERYRVRTIGVHSFFEWNELTRAADQPYFANLRASDRFWRVLGQIDTVKKLYAGPICFGPRLEFAYSVFGVPSPPHLAAWWDPGTAFAPERVPEMEAAWRANKFRTVILLKNDAVFYSQDFIDELTAKYQQDRRWKDLSVFYSSEPGAPKSPASK